MSIPAIAAINGSGPRLEVALMYDERDKTIDSYRSETPSARAARRDRGRKRHRRALLFLWRWCDCHGDCCGHIEMLPYVLAMDDNRLPNRKALVSSSEPVLPAMRRRDLLARIGAVAGAGALYSSMDALGLVAGPLSAPASYAARTAAWQPPRASDFALKGRSTRKILVLGAGIAGLTTAYELGKAGYQVTILEARQRPGGRNWTSRRGTVESEIGGVPQRNNFGKGQYMNMGPARIAQHMVTLEYCRELGVPVEIFTNVNADSYYYQEDAGGLSGQKIRHRTAKADYYGYISELLAKATDQGALDDRVNAEDKERLVEFLRSFGDLKAGRYTGSTRRGYSVKPGAGNEAGTPLAPPYALSDVLQSSIGEYFEFELEFQQAMLMFQPVGGMDRIPYAFADAIGRQGGRIVYGAPVTSLTNTSDGVEVVYQQGVAEHAARADFCVCTIPPQVLKKVPTNFSATVKDALAFAAPLAVGKMGLEYGRRFWEEDEDIYGGITNTNMDLTTIWYPSSGYLGRGGVLIGYYNFGPTAEHYGALSPDGRRDRAVAQGMKIHGDPYRSELRSAFSVAWHKIAYSEGGWVIWPDRTSGQYDRLLKPEGNTYFAGDHLSYYIAWQAGAIDSARAVVMALHERALTG
jgi:monoamine oxidase